MTTGLSLQINHNSLNIVRPTTADHENHLVISTAVVDLLLGYFEVMFT